MASRSYALWRRAGQRRSTRSVFQRPPGTEFTLSRLPQSGEVAGIRVTGNDVVPQVAIAALQPEYDFADSELLEGSLDDIADVLAREHERRTKGLTKDLRSPLEPT